METKQTHRNSSPRSARNNPRNKERGMALVLALLTLILLSAIGLGMMFMSDTETTVNSNYRDTQLAFFAMRGGLEEARDRMRPAAVSPLTLPTTMPGTANSILYITNPAGATDVVNPKTTDNAYFDDELCHENYVPLNVILTLGTLGVPCLQNIPANSVVYTASTSPNTNTASALKYKWVRITLKQNASITNATVDPAQAAGSQVCYQTLSQQEIPLSALGAYVDCTAAKAAGLDATPVYVVTSLAITPQGSRRMGQYEVAALNINPPPAALGLNGPSASFSPRPSSNNYFINGNDSGAAGYTAAGGTGTCTPSGAASVPGISTGDAAGVVTIDGQLTTNPDHSGNYTGAGGTPSVVNAGSGGTGAFSGAWSNPSELDGLVASLAAVADTTYSCGIGAPCSPAGNVGTNANPQITFVDGDFNYGNASGAGVLVVTGTLSFTGNANFNGLVLVIGQGIMTESGGGNGGFNGSIFVADTRSHSSPYSLLGSLGTPTYSWNGAGTSDIQYNSCWANIGSNSRFSIIAMREEMY